MPVRKYRSIEDMPAPPPLPPLDPGNLKVACDLSSLAARLRPTRFPPGIHKHRSLDAADRVRRRWEAER